MTHLTTSPFLTTPPGVACLTEATIMSPTRPTLRPVPPSTRMHISSFAPVLSATARRVNGWIIDGASFSDVGVSFQDLHQPPSLALRQRAGLHDFHDVADFRFVVFVVRHVFLRAADRFAVQLVPSERFHRHHDRFLHLVADDPATLHFTGSSFAPVASSFPLPVSRPGPAVSRCRARARAKPSWRGRFLSAIPSGGAVCPIGRWLAGTSG